MTIAQAINKEFMERVVLVPANTQIHINGLPFILRDKTAIKGHIKNIKLAGLSKPDEHNLF